MVLAGAAACQPGEQSGPTTGGAGSTEPSVAPSLASPTPETGWIMPDEGAAHEGTWMSFAVSDQIWGEELAPGAREALVRIAEAISKYEPVRVILPPEEEEPEVKGEISFVRAEADDLWMRDTGPTFVRRGEEVAGVDFNFNGWGGHQEHTADAKVAAEVCTAAEVERLTTALVLEGGALEVDGEGTAIITESCVLNKNRNPGRSKAQVEAELQERLGVTKVIWLPGIAGKDITDGHTDFYARFASPGVVVAGREDDPDSYDYAVTRKHLKILKAATDAKGRKLAIHVIPGPESIRDEYASDDFAAGYINFYVCNNAVIAPEFGDKKADKFAVDTLSSLFPDRKIVTLNIDPIAAGGGGIHCTTQQEIERSATE